MQFETEEPKGVDPAIHQKMIQLVADVGQTVYALHGEWPARHALVIHACPVEGATVCRNFLLELNRLAREPELARLMHRAFGSLVDHLAQELGPDEHWVLIQYGDLYAAMRHSRRVMSPGGDA